ncbi:permease prefix domain 1-containing protein [Actinopolymorpha alba]|uniref:permease prefix domain 1-containing protein n=1 Tax=Actinopolymorpha alba TaxID=533267 RepID=UPI0003762BCC|nr:permease prefix domain 1-containing protein [Actinopolymorpha alba]
MSERCERHGALRDGPIAAYVKEVERQLTGPPGPRRDLLSELEDGLYDAAEAHVRRSGLAAREAEERAVGECGQVAELAAAYRAELVASQARRTSRLLALAMPGLVFLWDIPWLVGGPWNTPSPRIVLLLSDITTVVGVGTGACALLAIAMLALGARVGIRGGLARHEPRVAAAIGLIGVAALIVTFICTSGLAVLNPDEALGAFVISWIGIPLQVITAVAVWCLVRSIIRTLRAARETVAT